MAQVSLKRVLHQAPLVTINGYEIDEDSWRFHPNGIRCAGPDDEPVFALKDRMVELHDDGCIVTTDADGVIVHIFLKKVIPFTGEDVV